MFKYIIHLINHMDDSERTFLSGNNTKAGLPELSRERIDQIIMEASKNSRFYQHQQRRLQQVAERARSLRLHQPTNTDVDRAEQEIDDYLTQIRETHKDGLYVHVDMDAFFAAVEQLHRPELADVPMAVGAEPMLSTANYKARQFGVSAAMPGFIARKLCPELVIVPHNYERYVAASEQVHAVFRRYDPNFSSFSLDEASLDFTKYLGGDVDIVVKEMREAVKSATGLTCSAGIGPTRQLAKMASNINKPDGQFTVPSPLLPWLHSQPVKRLCGAGKVTCALLKDAYDIQTIGDLYRNQTRVWLGLTRSRAEFLVSAAHGLASSAYDHHNGDPEDEDDVGRKSVSVERTHFPAITNLQQMDDILLDLSNLLFDDLQSKQLGCSNVAIKVKLADFQTLTRSCTVGHRIDSAREIYRLASQLLHKLAPASARLLGVRASALESTKPTLLDAFVVHSGGGDEQRMVQCPACTKQVVEERINDHLDTCLVPSQSPLKTKPTKKSKVGPMDYFTIKPDK